MATGVSLGMAAGTDVPLERLDYGYIRGCTDSREVEKLLNILRSGREGTFPDLIKFTEEKLSQLDPTSRLLLKENKKTTLRDLSSEEQQEIQNDMESWAQQMHSEETILTDSSTAHLNGERDKEERKREILAGLGLPPIRKSGLIGKPAPNPSVHTTTKSQRIGSTDFRSWDQYNADGEAEQADQDIEREVAEEGWRVDKTTRVKAVLSESEKDLSEVERGKLAVHEKEKGNESFRSGDIAEAAVYYTRSILLNPSAAAYNNRALMYIKLDRPAEAVEDCTKVLEQEPTNLKALFRLATARTNLKQYAEAIADFERLLQLDPSNRKALDQLRKLRQQHGEKTGSVDSRVKKNRLHIIEEEDCGEEEGEESTEAQDKRMLKGLLKVMEERKKEEQEREEEQQVEEKMEKGRRLGGGNGKEREGERERAGVAGWKPSVEQTDSSVENSSTRTVDGESNERERLVQATPSFLKTPPPLPPNVQQLKEKGNQMFRSGQYGDAVGQYTKAIDQLEKGDKENAPSLATLLNNRAACFLKTGECNRCIDDCNRSLSLHPLNLKALLRRASAFEMKEKYKEAYMDFHLSLRVDTSVHMAQQAISRLTRHLQDLYGLEWRLKLPPHPDADRVLDAYRAQRTLAAGDVAQVTPDGATRTQGKSTRTQRDILETEGTDSGAGPPDVPLKDTNASQPSEATDDGTQRAPVESAGTPPNATVAQEDTTQIPLDTTPVPEDTTQTPPDTTEDTTQTPLDTTPVPEDTTQTPLDTTPVPEDTTQTPPDTTEDTTQIPPDTTPAPEGTTESPPDTTEDTTEDTTQTQLDTTQTPPDTTQTPLDTTEDAACTPPDTTRTPLDSTPVPEDTTRTPPDTTPAPEDTTHDADSSEKLYDEYKSKGNRHVKKDEYTEAMSLYSKCIELFPDRAAAYNNRAFCYLKLRNPTAAEEDCSRALELEPDNIKALYRRGVARKELGCYKDAMRDMLTLLTHDSTNVAANKELEIVKQLWEKELRTIQANATTPPKEGKIDPRGSKKATSPFSSRGPTSTRGQVNTGGQTTTKVSTPRMKTTGGKSQSSAKSSTRGSAKNSPPNESKGGAKRGSGKAKNKGVAERVVPNTNTRKSAVEKLLSVGGEGEESTENPRLLTADKTIYYKKQEESRQQSGGERKRIKIVEVDGSSDEEEGEKEVREGEREVGHNGEGERGKGSGKKSSMKKKGRRQGGGGEEDKEGKKNTGDMRTKAQERKTPEVTQSIGNEPLEATEKVEQGASGDSNAPSTMRLTSYEFVQRWNSIPRSARSEDYAELLKLIPPEQLPEIITSKLDGTMLTNILRAVDEQFIPGGMYKVAADLLYHLSRVQRFSLVAMFLSKTEKEGLCKVLEVLSSQRDAEIAPETLEAIKISYDV